MGGAEKNWLVLARTVDAIMVTLMVIAPILVVTLWWTIPLFTGAEPGGADGWFLKYFLILTVAGVFAELVLWQAHKIVRNIKGGRPFCADTAHRLRVIGAEFLTVGVLYGVLTFFVTKFFMVVILLTCVIVGLLVLVFSELFRHAIDYKEENEMTI